MSRNFYGYAIFFSIVYLLCSATHTWISNELKERFLELPSIESWFLTCTVLGVLVSTFSIRYFYQRGFRFAFISSLVALAADLLVTASFFHVIRTHEITPVFILASLFSLVAGVVLSISLVLSNASTRVWLKRSGVVMLVSGLTSLLITVVALVSVEARLSGIVGTIEVIANLISLIAVVFTILNYVGEYRYASLPDERQEFIGLGLTFVSFVLIVTAGYIGYGVVKETRYTLVHPDEVPQYIKESVIAFQPRTYVNTRGDTLRYRLLYPKNYDSTRRYPLVLCLHGSSGSGQDNAKQVLTCLPAQILAQDSVRNEYPAYVMVPQCPRKMSFGGFSELPGIDSLVIEAMVSVCNEFNADTTRRYVTGYSLGGYGAWNMICKWPKLFAAAVPMCGKGDVDCAGRIKSKPVWAFHGDQDINVPVSGSRDMIEALQKAGGNPRYTEFPGRAHDITKEIIEMPEWMDWMFAQRLTLNTSL